MLLPVLLTAMLSSGVQASSNMQAINGFLIDRTEVSIAEFSQFATETGFISSAERAGGGEVYGLGWEQKVGLDLENAFRGRNGSSAACGALDL